jgi:peroxiredoxin/mono/diheme cytochrome c family protein
MIDRLRSPGMVWLAAAVLAACFGIPAMAADGEKPAQRPIDRMVGERVGDFTLNDAITGKPVRLYGFAGKRAVVLVFTGVECPVGNLYMPRLRELHETFKDRGVAFIAINSNESETAEQVAAHAREFDLPFPVLLDPTGRVARQFEVERTCEALVIDGRAALRYRGAIDDQYGYGVAKSAPEHHYLATAIDAARAEAKLEVTATSVAGCPIELAASEPRRPLPRVRAAAEEIVAALQEIDPEIDTSTLGPVNYSEHVAPILQERCQSCHREGEVAPFALLTYDDAKRRSGGILEVLDAHRMPPWHADPRYGQFANDRRLSAKERATLIAWVEQDMPRGDAAREPSPRTWPEGWSIGAPDVVFEMPKPFTVKAEGTLPYQRFRVKTNFTEDKWVQALEPRPGDRAVVHHIVIYLIAPGTKVRDLDDLEHLAAYAPGDLPTRLPDGVAKRIPAGSELVFEMHYTPIGKVRVDQSSLGIVFAKEPPKHRAVTMAIPNMRFRIAPGDPNSAVRSSKALDGDLQVAGFLPHMHLRGKDFKYTAKYADGSEEILLSVPRYDFAWQSYYWLREPKTLPKGTKVVCEAHFDNSTNNPALTEKDTQEEVRWGEQTWEEMMIGFMDVLLPNPGAASGASEATGG